MKILKTTKIKYWLVKKRLQKTKIYAGYRKVKNVLIDIVKHHIIPCMKKTISIIHLVLTKMDTRVTIFLDKHIAPKIKIILRPGKRILFGVALSATLFGLVSAGYAQGVSAATMLLKKNKTEETTRLNTGVMAALSGEEQATDFEQPLSEVKQESGANDINITSNNLLRDLIEQSPDVSNEPQPSDGSEYGDIVASKTPYIIAYDGNGAEVRSSVSQENMLRYLNGGPMLMARGSANSSGMLSWNGYATPRIWHSEIGDIYCIEPYVTFPDGNWYDDGSWISDEGIRTLLWYGFPSNYNGQWGLSDDEAYVRTFVALNAAIGNYNRSTVESYGDPYVNMLLQKFDSKDIPKEIFTITQPGSTEAIYNTQTNRLETDWYKTSGSGGNTYKLPTLPEGVYAVDGNNKKITGSVSIGTKFKLVSDDLTLETSVSAAVQSSVRPRAAIKFTAPAGTQDLIGLKARDPLPPVSIKATFAPAYIAVGGHKTTEDAEFKVLPGVTYGLYQADGRELTTVVTDEFGDFVTAPVAASLYGSGAYLREIKTADDTTFALDYQKFVLPDLSDPAVSGQIIDGVYYVNDNQNIINEYNEIGDLTIAKVDSVTKDPLAGAQFEFKRLSGEACPEVEAVTDNNSSDNNVAATVDCQLTRVYTTGADGYAVIPEEDFAFFKYGDYEVRELTAPPGYLLSDEVVKFTVDADQKIIHITFENDKIVELAVTGDGTFEALVSGLALIAVVGGVILISRSKKGRKGTATLAIALLIGAGVFATSGTQVFAATTENNEVEVTPMDKYNKTSKEVLKVFMLRDSEFIDPLDPDAEVPVDPIPEEPAPPVEENIVAEGNKDEGSTTPERPNVDGAIGVSDVSETSDYTGTIPNTGQNFDFVATIGIGIIVIVGGIMFKVHKRKSTTQTK